MSAEELPFPLKGSTLVTGPSNTGKTQLTARTLDVWLDRYGPQGVVAFEFGPEFEHEGQLLGGRLDRFTTVPDDMWYGVIDAHAPRAEGGTTEEMIERAADNARCAAELLDTAPAKPRAVFVNDATIPFQHEASEITRLTDYCDRATVAVLNAFESDELGTDDPISRTEQRAHRALTEWADRSLRREADG